MRREMLTAQHLREGELEIIENGGVAISATELLTAIRTGQIPLIDPPSADERRWCSHAHAGDTTGASGCACLVDEAGRRWCGLNGREAKSPCLFDAPNDPAWQEIAEYLEAIRTRGYW